MSSEYIYSNKSPKFCVYVTYYLGTLLPPFYVGSGSVDNIIKGYRGSVCSRKYKEIWNNERKNNPHLFKTEILKKFYSRKAATFNELLIQKRFNVVKSKLFINMSYAQPKGYFGISLDLKNKTYSERFGEDRAKQIREYKSKNSYLKGKSFEEVFGEDRAKQIKESISKRRKGKATHRGLATHAKKILIFDKNENLVRECYGNFKKICLENGWPWILLRNTIYSNGKIAPTHRNRNEMFYGWYARISNQ